MMYKINHNKDIKLKSDVRYMLNMFMTAVTRLIMTELDPVKQDYAVSAVQSDDVGGWSPDDAEWTVLLLISVLLIDLSETTCSLELIAAMIETLVSAVAMKNTVSDEDDGVRVIVHQSVGVGASAKQCPVEYKRVLTSVIANTNPRDKRAKRSFNLDQKLGVVFAEVDMAVANRSTKLIAAELEQPIAEISAMCGFRIMEKENPVHPKVRAEALYRILGIILGGKVIHWHDVPGTVFQDAKALEDIEKYARNFIEGKIEYIGKPLSIPGQRLRMLDSNSIIDRRKSPIKVAFQVLSAQGSMAQSDKESEGGIERVNNSTVMILVAFLMLLVYNKINNSVARKGSLHLALMSRMIRPILSLVLMMCVMLTLLANVSGMSPAYAWGHVVAGTLQAAYTDWDMSNITRMIRLKRRLHEMVETMKGGVGNSFRSAGISFNAGVLESVVERTVRELLDKADGTLDDKETFKTVMDSPYDDITEILNAKVYIGMHAGAASKLNLDRMLKIGYDRNIRLRKIEHACKTFGHNRFSVEETFKELSDLSVLLTDDEMEAKNSVEQVDNVVSENIGNGLYRKIRKYSKANLVRAGDAERSACSLTSRDAWWLTKILNHGRQSQRSKYMGHMLLYREHDPTADGTEHRCSGIMLMTKRRDHVENLETSRVVWNTSGINVATILGTARVADTHQGGDTKAFCSVLYKTACFLCGASPNEEDGNEALAIINRSGFQWYMTNVNVTDFGANQTPDGSGYLVDTMDDNLDPDSAICLTLHIATREQVDSIEAYIRAQQ
jgi:hypothetical protein